MKRVLLIVCACVALSGHLAAQEVQSYRGYSKNDDPLMRVHEAFMNAFVAYIESRDQGAAVLSKSESNGDTQSSRKAGDSCRIEVSSVTDNNGVSLMLTIGKGAPIRYLYTSDSSKSGNTTTVEEILAIECADSGRNGRRASTHQYTTNTYIEEGPSGESATSREFKYECNSSSQWIEL